MSALGLVALGLGILTVWSGLDRTIVFDVLRSFIGAPTTPRTTTGTLAPPSSSSASGLGGGGSVGGGGGGGGGGSF